MDLQEYLHGEYAIAIITYKYDKVSEPYFYRENLFGKYDKMSYKEAMEKIEGIDREVYVLENNEYRRPSYIIVDSISAGWVDSGRDGEMSNYDWYDSECNCGECRICTEMKNSQDIEYLKTKGKKILEEYKLLINRLKNEKGERIEKEELDNYTGKIMVQNIGTYYYYMKEGKLHREDGPAEIWPDGTKKWYKEGKLHRADGPAIEYPDGTKFWYKEGLRHRAEGPAIEWDDGTKEWWKEGKQHRENGPAVEMADGSKYWIKEDELHREDGPAIEYADGKKEYWLNGMEYKEEQYYEKIKKQELKKNVKKERNSSIEL